MTWGDTEELIEILTKTPALLQVMTGRIPNDVARSVQSPDDWSVVEVVGHLTDAERRSIMRINQIIDEDRPTLDVYDQDELVERQRYREHDLTEVQAQFLQLRAERLLLLNGLQPADWDRIGVHEALGPVSIRQITTHMCAHDVNHLAQIASLVAVH